jgi:hypothetical protein
MHYVEKSLGGFWPGAGAGSFSGLVTGQVEAAPLAATDVVWRWCHYQFLLSGEPAMPVWVPAGSGVAGAPSFARQPVAATVVRGVLCLRGGEPAVLLDRAGRKVADLVPGDNDLVGIATGVYFLCPASGVGRQASSGRKVVVSR